MLHADPFILAAQKMGLKARNCVVFEDSPSGIKAGIASGAKVIAVSTSHPVEKIRGIGTFLVSGKHCMMEWLLLRLLSQVPDLSHVKIEPYKDGKLKVTVDEESIADDGQKKKEASGFVETNHPKAADED